MVECFSCEPTGSMEGVAVVESSDVPQHAASNPEHDALQGGLTKTHPPRTLAGKTSRALNTTLAHCSVVCWDVTPAAMKPEA